MKFSIPFVLLAVIFTTTTYAEVLEGPLTELALGWDFLPTDHNGNQAKDTSDHTNLPDTSLFPPGNWPYFNGMIGYQWVRHRQSAISVKLQGGNPSRACYTDDKQKVGYLNGGISFRTIMTPDFLYGGYAGVAVLAPHDKWFPWSNIADVKENLIKLHVGADFIVFPMLSRIPYPLQITLGGHITQSSPISTLCDQLIAYDNYGGTLQIAADLAPWVKPFFMGYYRNHGGKIHPRPDIRHNAGIGLGFKCRLGNYLTFRGQGAWDYHSGFHAKVECHLEGLGSQPVGDKSLQSYLKQEIPYDIAPITFLNKLERSTTSVSSGRYPIKDISYFSERCIVNPDDDSVTMHFNPHSASGRHVKPGSEVMSITDINGLTLNWVHLLSCLYKGTTVPVQFKLMISQAFLALQEKIAKSRIDPSLRRACLEGIQFTKVALGHYEDDTLKLPSGSWQMRDIFEKLHPLPVDTTERKERIRKIVSAYSDQYLVLPDHAVMHRPLEWKYMAPTIALLEEHPVFLLLPQHIEVIAAIKACDEDLTNAISDARERFRQQQGVLEQQSAPAKPSGAPSGVVEELDTDTHSELGPEEGTRSLAGCDEEAVSNKSVYGDTSDTDGDTSDTMEASSPQAAKPSQQRQGGAVVPSSRGVVLKAGSKGRLALPIASSSTQNQADQAVVVASQASRKTGYRRREIGYNDPWKSPQEQEGTESDDESQEGAWGHDERGIDYDRRDRRLLAAPQQETGQFQTTRSGQIAFAPGWGEFVRGALRKPHAEGTYNPKNRIVFHQGAGVPPTEGLDPLSQGGSTSAIMTPPAGQPATSAPPIPTPPFASPKAAVQAVPPPSNTAPPAVSSGSGQSSVAPPPAPTSATAVASMSKVPATIPPAISALGTDQSISVSGAQRKKLKRLGAFEKEIMAAMLDPQGAVCPQLEQVKQELAKLYHLIYSNMEIQPTDTTDIKLMLRELTENENAEYKESISNFITKHFSPKGIISLFRIRALFAGIDSAQSRPKKKEGDASSELTVDQIKELARVEIPPQDGQHWEALKGHLRACIGQLFEDQHLNEEVAETAGSMSDLKRAALVYQYKEHLTEVNRSAFRGIEDSFPYYLLEIAFHKAIDLNIMWKAIFPDVVIRPDNVTTMRVICNIIELSQRLPGRFTHLPNLEEVKTLLGKMTPKVMVHIVTRSVVPPEVPRGRALERSGQQSTVDHKGKKRAQTPGVALSRANDSSTSLQDSEEEKPRSDAGSRHRSKSRGRSERKRAHSLGGHYGDKGKKPERAPSANQGQGSSASRNPFTGWGNILGSDKSRDAGSRHRNPSRGRSERKRVQSLGRYSDKGKKPERAPSAGRADSSKGYKSRDSLSLGVVEDPSQKEIEGLPVVNQKPFEWKPTGQSNLEKLLNELPDDFRQDLKGHSWPTTIERVEEHLVNALRGKIKTSRDTELSCRAWIETIKKNNESYATIKQKPIWRHLPLLADIIDSHVAHQLEKARDSLEAIKKDRRKSIEDIYYRTYPEQGKQDKQNKKHQHMAKMINQLLQERVFSKLSVNDQAAVRSMESVVSRLKLVNSKMAWEPSTEAGSKDPNASRTSLGGSSAGGNTQSALSYRR
jgi:hypothetical protein